jgi:hypothetical protein
MRAYSHQGHGPRADQQAGYISATSHSTPSLANGSRSIHSGAGIAIDESERPPRVGLTRSTDDRRTAGFGAELPTPPQTRYAGSYAAAVSDAATKN